MEGEAGAGRPAEVNPEGLGCRHVLQSCMSSDRKHVPS
jgi:hypothetical protein